MLGTTAIGRNTQQSSSVPALVDCLSQETADLKSRQVRAGKGSTKLAGKRGGDAHGRLYQAAQDSKLAMKLKVKQAHSDEVARYRRTPAKKGS